MLHIWVLWIMELISCLLWSCLICVVAKELCSRALDSSVRSFCSAGRLGWVGSLWSHSWVARWLELSNSWWRGSLCYVVLVHFCGSAMAVEVPILAHQRGAVALDQPPEGAALLGKPGDPWPGRGVAGWPPSWTPSVGLKNFQGVSDFAKIL